MKFLALLTVFFFASPAFAQKKDPKFFTCGSSGSNSLRILVGGPRYADQIAVKLLDEEGGAFLLPKERGQFELMNPGLHGFLEIGTCRANPTSDVLVRCASEGTGENRGWALLNYYFSKREDLGEGHSQTVTILREARDEELELEVRKVGDQAHLKLTLQFDTAAEKKKRLEVDRVLGSLNDQWFTCRFE